MSMSGLVLQDYFNIPNALFRFQDPVSSGASVSFDIDWSGPITDRVPVTSPAASSGELLMNQATMTWSARNDMGFSFVSEASPTTSAFAEIGTVKNGVFA